MVKNFSRIFCVIFVLLSLIGADSGIHEKVEDANVLFESERYDEAPQSWLRRPLS